MRSTPIGFEEKDWNLFYTEGYVPALGLLESAKMRCERESDSLENEINELDGKINKGLSNAVKAVEKKKNGINSNTNSNTNTSTHTRAEGTEEGDRLDIDLIDLHSEVKRITEQLALVEIAKREIENVSSKVASSYTAEGVDWDYMHNELLPVRTPRYKTIPSQLLQRSRWLFKTASKLQHGLYNSSCSIAEHFYRSHADAAIFHLGALSLPLPLTPGVGGANSTPLTPGVGGANSTPLLDEIDNSASDNGNSNSNSNSNKYDEDEDVDEGEKENRRQVRILPAAIVEEYRTTGAEDALLQVRACVNVY